MNILNSLDTFDSGDNPNFNTGTLFDLPTGKYVQGIDGEWYLTGGLPMHITVFGGRNGHFKSTITNAYAQRITAIYPDSDLIVEDTEDSLTKDKERAYAMAEELAPKINKSNVQWLKGIDYDLDSFDKWFKDYCQNVITASDVLKRCHSPEISMIMAKADLSSVNPWFHYHCTGTSTPQEFDKFMDKKFSEVFVL